MAELNNAEEAFIDLFIKKDKQERYRFKLAGKKHRKEMLDSLNHHLDFREDRALKLKACERNHDWILNSLKNVGTANACNLIADGCELDGERLDLEEGVNILLTNPWGTILICDQPRCAFYKEEDPGDMYLFQK